MRARLMRAVAAALMLIGVAAWLACFVKMFGAESAAARAVDGALLVVGIGVLTLLSFLIWPRRA